MSKIVLEMSASCVRSIFRIFHAGDLGFYLLSPPTPEKCLKYDAEMSACFMCTNCRTFYAVVKVMPAVPANAEDVHKTEMSGSYVRSKG